jgi:hypothetical protein
MTAERPRTAIEVKFVPSESQKLFGKIFHFFHLDSVGEAVYKASHFLISVDSVETDEPMTEPHLRDCTPGEHLLEVAVKNFDIPSGELSRFMNGTSIKVNVPEGTTVRVNYIPSNIQLPTGHNARLELASDAKSAAEAAPEASK